MNGTIDLCVNCLSWSAEGPRRADRHCHVCDRVWVADIIPRPTESRPHSHYFKSVAHLDEIDVYRVLELFGVTDPVAQHIAKKALAAGRRGHKDLARDMQDIADSAKRWLQMREEDARAST